jgi:hypothetical protein
MLVSSSLCHPLLIPWVPDDFPQDSPLGTFLLAVPSQMADATLGPSDHVPIGVPALTPTALLATWLPPLQPLASGPSSSCPWDEASPPSPLPHWQMYRLHPQNPGHTCASASTVLSPIMWLPETGFEQTRLGLWWPSSLPSWPSFYPLSVLGQFSFVSGHTPSFLSLRTLLGWHSSVHVALQIFQLVDDQLLHWFHFQSIIPLDTSATR